MTELDVIRDDVLAMLKAPLAAVLAPESAVETVVNSGCCKTCDETVVVDATDFAAAADDTLLTVVTDVVATAATVDVTAVANFTEAVTGVTEAVDVTATGKLTETVVISFAKSCTRSRDVQIVVSPASTDDVALAAKEETTDPDAHVTVSDAVTVVGDTSIGVVTSGDDASGTVVMTRVSLDTRRLRRTCLRLDARPGLSATTSRCSVSSDESDPDDTFN